MGSSERSPPSTNDSNIISYSKYWMDFIKNRHVVHNSKQMQQAVKAAAPAAAASETPAAASAGETPMVHGGGDLITYVLGFAG